MSQGKPCCEPKCELMLISCTAGDEGAGTREGAGKLKLPGILSGNFYFSGAKIINLILTLISPLVPSTLCTAVHSVEITYCVSYLTC